MIYYHSTLTSNERSILRGGLQPRTRDYPFSFPVTFLDTSARNSVEEASEMQVRLLDNSGKAIPFEDLDSKITVFKVDIPSNFQKYILDEEDFESDTELAISVTIPSKYLSVYKRIDLKDFNLGSIGRSDYGGLK